MSREPHLMNNGLIMEWPLGLMKSIPTDAWLVVHALPRQDKLLIEALRQAKIPGCAFFERRVRVYPGKGKQESIVPLLGGYIFVAAGQAAKETIYRTERAVRIIDVTLPKLLAADLACLCALVSVANVPLVVRPEIVTGKRITLTQGVFSGCSGVVVKRQNHMDLFVNLELLGHSVSVTLPAEFAELA